MKNGKTIGQVAGPVAAGLIWSLGVYLQWPEESRCVLAAAAWMLVWWISEAVPLGVTSILPIVLFPLMGIADVAETTAPYGSHYVFLFMGGFLIAIALERWDLHRRFALNVLVSAGGKPRRLIAGFMFATAALSMWISNTATTLMMLPIAMSVISKIDSERRPRFATALLLGTAYAANIGGIATLVGTPPNVAMAGILEEQFLVSVPFLEWMLMATPFSFCLLIIVYWLLTRVLCKVDPEDLEGGLQGIRQDLKALGSWSTAEKRVAVVFSLTGMLWVGRRWLVDVFEWSLNDTTIAIAAGVSLFLIPAQNDHTAPLLNWKDAQKLPWEILLLFGGGLTLANALKEADVLTSISQTLAQNQHMSLAALIGIFVVSALLLTEVMSNLALTVVMVPVVGQVAIQWGVDPLMLIIPVTMASSCAFMLPMATPPNAIIFGSNRIRMSTMAQVGFVLNLVAAGLAWIWAMLILPKWVEFL